MASSSSNCTDILNSKNSNFENLMTKIMFDMNQIPNSTINNLSTNAQEFYKKREIKIRHHKFNSKTRKRVKNTNVKENIKLNNVYIRLALVRSGFDKIKSNKNKHNLIFLRNATQQASDIAKDTENFFKQLEKDM